MKPCPVCKEPIQDEALKCHHCDSMFVIFPDSLSHQAEDKQYVKYILDRDLIRFGKFAVAILSMFLIVGVYLYGIHLKDLLIRFETAKDNIATMEKQISKDQSTISEKIQSLELKMSEASKHIDKKISSFNLKVEEIDALRANFEASAKFTTKMNQFSWMVNKENISRKLEKVNFNDGRATDLEIKLMTEIRDALLKIKPLVENALTVPTEELTRLSPTLKEYYCTNLKRAFNYYDIESSVFTTMVKEYDINFPDHVPPLGITVEEARDIRRLGQNIPEICQ
jgi:hypothetical protein